MILFVLAFGWQEQALFQTHQQHFLFLTELGQLFHLKFLSQAGLVLMQICQLSSIEPYQIQNSWRIQDR